MLATIPKPLASFPKASNPGRDMATKGSQSATTPPSKLLRDIIITLGGRHEAAPFRQLHACLEVGVMVFLKILDGTAPGLPQSRT